MFKFRLGRVEPLYAATYAVQQDCRPGSSPVEFKRSEYIICRRRVPANIVWARFSVRDDGARVRFHALKSAVMRHAKGSRNIDSMMVEDLQELIGDIGRRKT